MLFRRVDWRRSVASSTTLRRSATRRRTRARSRDQKDLLYASASKEHPHIHEKCPMSLNGKVRMNWTQKETFDTGGKVKPRVETEVTLKYRREDYLCLNFPSASRGAACLLLLELSLRKPHRIRAGIGAGFPVSVFLGRFLDFPSA